MYDAISQVFDFVLAFYERIAKAMRQQLVKDRLSALELMGEMMAHWGTPVTLEMLSSVIVWRLCCNWAASRCNLLSSLRMTHNYPLTLCHYLSSWHPHFYVLLRANALVRCFFISAKILKVILNGLLQMQPQYVKMTQSALGSILNAAFHWMAYKLCIKAEGSCKDVPEMLSYFSASKLDVCQHCSFL